MNALLQFSERFGHMLSRTFLTILYFAVLGPFAVLYRLFADPLHIRKPGDSNFVGWVPHNNTLRSARRQD